MRHCRPLLVMPLLALLAACATEPVAPPPAASPSGATEAAEAEPAGGSAAPSSGAAEQRLRAAPAATTGAGSARTTYLATLTGIAGLPGGTAMTVTGRGEADFATGRMRSTIDLSAVLDSAPAGGRRAGIDPSWETISANGVVYLRSPMLAELLGLPTPWARIDPSSELLGAAGFSSLGQVAASGSGGPLALLAGVVRGSVSDLGAEVVHGVTTSHLRATVDVVDAAMTGGDQTGTRAGSLAGFLEGFGGRRLAVDAFLDVDDRVRRLIFEHELAPEAGGGTQRVELNYADFAMPVEIELPAPGQVTDLEQALGER